MYLIRSFRTPRAAHPHRTYNRYTGGVERATSSNHPPSRYGRSSFSTASNSVEPDRKDSEESLNQEEVPEDNETLKDKKVALLEEKLNEVKNNWQSSLAETDNITKKMLKDIAHNREAAADKLAVSLFPVSDTIDFCLVHKPDFESEELQSNVDAKGAFDGLEAAKRQFVSAMRSLNIDEIVPELGDKFDPMLHNACFEVEAKNGLEQYAFSVRNQCNNQLKDKLSESDKKTLLAACEDVVKWLEHNQSATLEEFEDKQKEFEGIVHPIMTNLMQGAGGAGGMGGMGGMPDMGGMGGMPNMGGQRGGAGHKESAGPKIEEVD